MAFMQTIFEAHAKSQKKASKSKKHSATMTPVTVPTVNRKLGMATRDLV